MKSNNRKVLFTSILLWGVTSVFAGSNELGIDLYRAQLYNAAKIFFMEQTNQSAAEKAENQYYLGQTYYDLQQIDSASFCYDKAVETDPEYPFGYIGQGKILLGKGDGKEAENLFKKANGLAKKDPSVQTSIAEVYIAAKMYPQAEEALEKARKVNKKFPGIYAAEGDMLIQQDKPGEAYGRYDMAISFDKTFKIAYLKSAQAYKTINPTEAMKYLNNLIAIAPDYIPAYAELGDIYREDGKYLQALDAYKKFIAIPGVPLLQQERYAQLLYYTESYTESLEHIKQILQQQGLKNPIMLRFEAYNNFKLENYTLVVEQLNHFLKTVPEKDHIYLDYLNLGRSLVKEKQYDQAIAAFTKASEDKNAKSEAWKELASAYDKAKNYPDAIKTYEKYFELEQTPVVFDFYYYGMDNYYMTAGYVSPEYLNAQRTPEQQAIDDADMKSYVEKGNTAFDEVISRSPESYLGYLYKAHLNAIMDAVEQTKTGKTQGLAKPFYEKAIEIMLLKNDNGARNNDLLASYSYLGSYYYVLFDTDKTNKEAAAQAGEYFKKILEISPDNQGAKSVLDALKIKY